MEKNDREGFLKPYFLNLNMSMILTSLFMIVSFFSVEAKEVIKTRETIDPINKIVIQHSVSGTVTDSDNMPLPGANIVEKGTSNGVTADFDGNFSIEVDSDAVLVFSYIGFESKEIPVNRQSTISVSLKEDAAGLDEVIVVGYGTQQKKSLSAAVSQIKGEEVETTTATSLAQKLAGKVSGLNIRQSDGEPGSYRNDINIRGFGSPIYVIDGIKRGGSADFQRLSSDDIESISVLKDASAAIYGLNAANGVIIVTTKKGSSGKTKFTYTTTGSFSSPTDVPELMNAAQYSVARNEANLNAGLNAYFTDEELALYQSPNFNSTDWTEEALLSQSFRSEHNLSASGGSDKLSYYVHLGYVKDNGLLRSGDMNYTKYSFRTNLTANLTKNITAQFNVSGIKDIKNAPSAGIFSILRGTISSLPINTVYANNNPDYINRVQDGQSINPVALGQSDLTGYSIGENNVFQTSFDLNYKAPFANGLEFKGLVAYDPSFNQSKFLAKDYQMYDYDVTTDEYAPTAFNKPSQINNGYSNFYTLTLRASVDYKTTIADNHNISAIGILEKIDYFRRSAGINKYFDFFTNAQIDQAGTTNQSSSGSEEQQRNMSYIGKLNYDYKGKYLLEASARYDGSYRYAPDVRWGLFPSVSAGWRVSEEGFMKNISWLTNLKFRGSYGIIGQDAGNPFQYIPAFSTSGGGTYEFQNGTLTNGAATPSIVNPGLTWTESEITDIGVDIGFFKSKLNITADVYQRNRTGLLAYRNVALPNTFGGTLPQENLNSDRVRGAEFSFAYNDNIGDFNFSISGNYNLARTMNVYVESSPFTSSFNEYRGSNLNRYNDMVWGYTVIGQFKNQAEIDASPIQDGTLGNRRELPGDFKYADLNGDNVIDGNDLSPIAYNSTPKVNYGLTLSGSWRGFDFSALMQGAAKFSVRYTHAYTTMFWGDGNTPAYFMDRWHKADYSDPNSEWIPGEWPAFRDPANVAPQMYAESSAWRKDASYVRLKNIELGYTIKNQRGLDPQSIGLDAIRIYTNLNNVFTWTDEFLKPFDPERNASSNNGLGTGWSYPILRTFNLGINVKF